MEKWKPLNREQALASRDFLRAGETFVDHKGQLHEIQYAILTPLGYQVYVSLQALQHFEKHAIPLRHQTNLPHLLNNPDLIVPSYEFKATHLYYKVIAKTLFVIAVQQKTGFRFVATMHPTPTIKGIKENIISQADFLYIRGGFKWKKWK